MRVPASPLSTIRPGLVLLRYNRDLATVQELKHQQEDLISHRIHRYHLGVGPPRRVRAHPERVEARLRLGLAEVLPEEQASGRQDAPVRVDQTPLYAEGYIAESLAVD